VEVFDTLFEELVEILGDADLVTELDLHADTDVDTDADIVFVDSCDEVPIVLEDVGLFVIAADDVLEYLVDVEKLCIADELGDFIEDLLEDMEPLELRVYNGVRVLVDSIDSVTD